MILKQKIVSVLNKLPYIRGIKNDLLSYEKWGLPGHFYNPIPDLDEVINYEYSTNFEPYAGINLNIENQFKFIENNISNYNELSIPEEKSPNTLYYFNNPNYSYSDAIFYYFVLRTFKPNKIIEIGSGYSTCLAIDINRIYFNGMINITSIEPYPELLITLTQDQSPIIFKSKVQEVDLSLFDNLATNDILFIDSSHVLKSGSDLNHILFNIIPKLKEGVLIHFHDIFAKFKYPKEWIINYYRAWNEIYALRLFLMYNNHFEIIAFNNYLINAHYDWFNENMPLCLKNTGGSIWLKKIK